MLNGILFAKPVHFYIIFHLGELKLSPDLNSYGLEDKDSFDAIVSSFKASLILYYSILSYIIDIIIDIIKHGLFGCNML